MCQSSRGPRLDRTMLLAAILSAAGAGCSAPAAGIPAAALRQSAAPVGAAPAGPPRLVRGMLIDSLVSNVALPGALVTVAGIDGGALTGAAGEFQFDGLRAGQHRMLVRHPILDSLGIDTIGLDLNVGDRNEPISVSLPVPAAFVATRCSGAKGRAGDGMILGVVRRSDSDAPVAGAEVAAAWRGIDSTYAGGGMRERIRVRANEFGQFVICRAPRFSHVELWAQNTAGETPRLRVQLGAAAFAAYDFSVDMSDRRDTTMLESEVAGTLGGRILMLDGDGLPNVTVILDRPAVRTTTDLTGHFSFGRVPAGVRTIDVRALGFRPMRVGVNLRPAQRLERDITLDRTVAVLGTMTVRANRRATWDSVGFDERKRRGGGYFFTRENLSGINDLATALRLVPGIRGKSTDRSQRLIAGRGSGCFPAFVVNGIRFTGGAAIGPEAMIRSDDIRAMEVYTSRLSTPPEHQRFGDCAVIVIWLRDPQAEREALGAQKPKPAQVP